MTARDHEAPLDRRDVLKLGLGLGAVAGLASVPFVVGGRDTTLLVARPDGDVLGFGPSGLGGGGFTSVVAVDPHHEDRVLAGQDVAGLWRSTDAGRRWRPANGKTDPASALFTHTSELHVATVRFSRTVPGTVYAGVGNRARQPDEGGFLASVDGGRHWELRSARPVFTGDGTTVDGEPVGGLPVAHPRSTGNLLQLDEEAGFVYAATFVDGVMRSADDGYTWTVLGLDGSYLRSLALDDTDADVLYACPYGEHVWKTTDARGSGRFERLDASPPTVEELIVLDGVLYAAAGADGVVSSTDGGRSWRPLYKPAGESETRWESIAARRGPGGPVLFAGAWKPPEDPRHPESVQSIVRSSDGGRGWRNIAISSAVAPTLGGPDGERWWYRQADAWESSRVGRDGFVASYLEPDPFDDRRLYVAGRAGVWRTDDAGAAAPTWYPCARRLNSTVNLAVAVDPNRPERVYVGDADWSVLYSTDRMGSVRIDRPHPAYANVPDIALDTTSTPARVCVVTDVKARGEAYSSPDPTAEGWVAEGLADAVRARCGRHESSLGVAVNRVGGERVILAAVERAGVWRKSGGAWRQVLRAAQALGPQGTERAVFCWLPGSRHVFLYDRETGVWRSGDHGRTWTLIWKHPSGESLGLSGFVLHPPTARDVVYASASDGLYRIDRALTKAPSPTRIPQVTNPGPMAFARGCLYVAGYASADSPRPRLYRTRLADPDSEWTDVADDTYREMSYFPRGLAVGPDGYVYVANRNTGVTVGAPRRPAPGPGERDDTRH